MEKIILYLYFFSIISGTTWYFSSKFLPLSYNGLSIILLDSHRFLSNLSRYIMINLATHTMDMEHLELIYFNSNIPSTNQYIFTKS